MLTRRLPAMKTCCKVISPQASRSGLTRALHSTAFQDKAAIVTGGASGIGRAISIALHSYGARVTALDVNKCALNTLKGDCPGLVAIQVDLADAAQISPAMEAAGEVDMLVNNAAITILEPFLELKLENFQKVQQVNATAPLLVAQCAARSMIKGNRGGSIVNVSSLASMVAVHEHTSYCMSKAALDALTRMMALELGPHGIRVNSLNPTLVDGGMGKRALTPEVTAPIKARIPLGQLPTEEDVVQAVLLLLQAEMVSGHSLPLDGGTSIRL